MARVQIESSPTGVKVVCSGEWDVLHLDAAAAELTAALSTIKALPVEFDLIGLERIDTAGALLLNESRLLLEKKGSEVRYNGMDDKTLRLMELTERNVKAPAMFPRQEGLVESIGRWADGAFRNALELLAFIGRTFLSFVNLFKSGTALRVKEIVYQINESAIKALGIIALTMFLVGIVVAYQSAVQLKTYGANIFIVDALGISILRELGPMLTAVIVAGRSGSAYAAQIGVMKMTEEIDAMRTMGFDPYIFLVQPRLIALIIMMPILIFFADVFGMVGGMLIAHTELGLTSKLFLDRFEHAVALKHFWVGIAKGPFFAVLIASIGIFRGLKVKNDTESIGINTTKSVVEAIFAVIICDALFSILFTKLGF